KGVSLFAKGLSNIIRFSGAAVDLIKSGANSVKKFRENNKKEEKAESEFLKKELKKRGVTGSKFRAMQRQQRRNDKNQQINEQKDLSQQISAEDQVRADARLTKQQETNDLRAEEQAEADEEIFAEIQNFTDKVVQDLEIKNQKRLDTEKKFQENFASLTDKARDEFTEAEKEALNDEIERIRDGKKTRTQIQAEALMAEEKQRTAAHNKFLKDEAEFGTLMAELKKIQGEHEYTATKTAADSLAGLINSENDELKSIGKAATIVQIGMSTAEGALKAFTSLAWIPYVGPVLGGIAAASLIAYGGEQISKVNAMQTGGIVPGTGSGDIVPTMLEPGELVVPKKEVAGVMAMMGARGMREGGVVGAKESEKQYKEFSQIFSVPGIFKALLGMDGGDSGTSAAGPFTGIVPKMMGALEAAADELLRVFLSAVPGGEIIYEAIKLTKKPLDELKKMLGDSAIADLMEELDLSDEIIGGFMGAGTGVVGAVEGLVKGLGSALGFRKGGIVPGNGSGDIVPALLEPGEIVIPNGFASSIGGLRSRSMSRPSITGSRNAGSSGGGERTIRVINEIGIQDDFIDYITVKQREKEELGT
ncbi:MAG: hypothetical protein ACYSWP_18705, partial [Planctomycetota bacterium]